MPGREVADVTGREPSPSHPNASRLRASSDISSICFRLSSTGISCTIDDASIVLIFCSSSACSLFFMFAAASFVRNSLTSWVSVLLFCDSFGVSVSITFGVLGFCIGSSLLAFTPTLLSSRSFIFASSAFTFSSLSMHFSHSPPVADVPGRLRSGLGELFSSSFALTLFLEYFASRDWRASPFVGSALAFFAASVNSMICSLKAPNCSCISFTTSLTES